jgi:hypothetical protein
MPSNNTLIMMGLGLAALFMLRNRGASEEVQASQLAGAAMMASGEGTAPDAPFQEYSAPANPVFFFNQGGQMAKVPGSPVPMGATSDEDIGVYPGGINRPELEFEVARSVPAAGTSDISPTTPEFQGTPWTTVTSSTIWDEQSRIAEANFMPLLAIEDTGGGGINIVGSSVDIATLDTKERIADFATSSARFANVDTGFAFTSTPNILGEYVRGFTDTPSAPPNNTVVLTQTGPVDNYPAWAGGNNWWDEG